METNKAIATTSVTTFRMTHTVRRTVRARAARVWALLTDADGFPKWNSTVTRLVGPIELGRKLRIEVPAAPGRVFSPKVTALVREKSMTWSDGMAPMFSGVRTFSLAEAPGGTEFVMSEVLSGLMLPLARRALPDFGPIFEAYADDLARAAEDAS